MIISTTIISVMRLIVVFLVKVHDIDEECGCEQENSFMQGRFWREVNCECVRICELDFTHHFLSYQVTSPCIPLLLNNSIRSSTVIHHIKHNSTRHTLGNRSLVTRRAWTKAEVSCLTAGPVDSHALFVLLVRDVENAIAAVEYTLHYTADLIVCIEETHLRRVQTENYVKVGAK